VDVVRRVEQTGTHRYRAGNTFALRGINEEEGVCAKTVAIGGSTLTQGRPHRFGSKGCSAPSLGCRLSIDDCDGGYAHIPDGTNFI
jgi:hypothetical protein